MTQKSLTFDGLQGQRQPLLSAPL